MKHIFALFFSCTGQVSNNNDFPTTSQGLVILPEGEVMNGYACYGWDASDVGLAWEVTLRAFHETNYLDYTNETLDKLNETIEICFTDENLPLNGFAGLSLHNVALVAIKFPAEDGSVVEVSDLVRTALIHEFLHIITKRSCLPCDGDPLHKTEEVWFPRSELESVEGIAYDLLARLLLIRLQPND